MFSSRFRFRFFASLPLVCLALAAPIRIAAFSRASYPRKIASLAFSPDGAALAAGAYGEVLLLDPAGGGIRAQLAGIGCTVNAVAFSPDGSLVAAAGGEPGRDGEIQLWDWRARRLTRTIRAHADAIYAIAFSPNGEWLAAGSYDHLVSLHRVRSSEPPRLLKDHTDAVYAVSFSPDGLRLASASGDRTVKLWEVASGRRVYTLSEPTAELYAVAFRPGGRQLAAAGADKMIRVWDLASDHGRLAESAYAHDGAILRLLYIPDGARLISSSEDRSVKSWDAEQLAAAGHLEKQPDWPLAIALDPASKHLAVGRFDGSVAIYEAVTGKRVREVLGK
jgi:WD40 repeat protein